ncbi:hypothetical protein J1G35_26750 [Pseudomonas sp. SH10-3B]|uniref:hypothetical protein n=1 Tax=Pseudomonas sp. SH10-3B TaxID=2816049 RepID=UPI001CA7B618|nr:hypothetical protein [Pseudomonas sp. SH10-3B]MBY8949466.1 hypothetical protein [Pseudomonas sp. SH10-3B]
MIKATQKQSSKQHRRTCKNPSCKSKFSTTDSRKVYCRPDCQAAKHIITKRKSTYEIPKTNHFMVYITKEVQRAGTLHVLDQLVGSVEALEALYTVVRMRLVANVLTGPTISADGKRTDPFHAGHIAPVRHEYVLGMLCAENLIVLPAKLNRTHSNAHINGAGVFMYRSDMQIRNTILSNDQDILERAIAYIGVDTVAEFCKKAKLAPSQRAAALNKLFALVDPADESHAPYIALLADKKATTPQLVAAIEAIQCKEQFKPLMRGEKLTPSAMLIQELIRHAAFRPELDDYAAICRAYTNDGYHFDALSVDSQSILSRLLHGEFESEDVTDELKFDLRTPTRAANARAERIAQRQIQLNAEETIRAAALKKRQATWEFAALEADVCSGFQADYCFIPYMMPPLTLNLTKGRHVPFSGSILLNGEVAF